MNEERLNIKIINTRLYLCLIHFLVSLILFAVVYGLDLGKSFSFMEIYGYYSIFIYVLLLLSELRYRGLSLFMIFLVGTFSRLVLPTISMAQAANDGENFSFYINYTDYIFYTSLAMNMYYMMFMLTLTYFAKDKNLSINLNVLYGIKHLSVYVIIIYILGFIARALPDTITFADSLRRYLSLFPTLALLILAFYCAYRNSKAYLILYIVLTVLDIGYAIFFGFYKQPIVLPGVIFVLYYFLRCRNIGKPFLNARFILYIALFGLFVYSFVFPFITLKRSVAYWDPATNITLGNYDNIELIEDVIRGRVADNYSSEERTDAIADRQNAITKNAYFFKSADLYGFHTDIMKQSLSLPIPRFLGGGSKIENHQGYMASSYMDNGNFKVSKYGIHAATYLGAFASAFFFGGWLATILMCIFNGWLISWMLRFSMKNARNPFAVFLLLQLVYGSLACFEETHDGGLDLARNLLIIVILTLVTNIFLKKKKNYEIVV